MRRGSRPKAGSAAATEFSEGVRGPLRRSNWIRESLDVPVWTEHNFLLNVLQDFVAGGRLGVQSSGRVGAKICVRVSKPSGSVAAVAENGRSEGRRCSLVGGDRVVDDQVEAG